MLFERLPTFPPALPDDELRLLASLPDWDDVAQIAECFVAAARRLERRKLIRVCRWKDDPCAMRPTLYAGKLPAANLAQADR